MASFKVFEHDYYFSPSNQNYLMAFYSARSLGKIVF